MIDNEKIGRSIRALREKAGYTQKQLAEQLYVSAMAVSKWERGKSIPDVSVLKQLAVILDMDIDGLIAGTATYLDDTWKGLLLLDKQNAVPADTVLCDKPVIDYLIGYFLLVGIRELHVLCSEREKAFIDRRFGEGERLGICLRCIVGPEPGKKGWYEQSNLMFIPEPFFIYGVDLTRFLQRGMQHKTGITNMLSVVGNGDRRIPANSTAAEAVFSQYRYQAVPLYFLPSGQAKNCRSANELRVLVQQAADNVGLIYEPMDKGFLVSALQSESDTARASELVRLIQELCGCLLYCPFEIAWRRGMIRKAELLQAAKDCPEYSGYIGSL